MPLNYRNYNKNFLIEVRPAMLKRAEINGVSCCEFCKVSNYKHILRGTLYGKDAYQDADLKVFDGQNSELLKDDWEDFESDYKRAIKIVLTIAHLDHSTTNDDPSNLKVLCQRCHLKLDDEQHRQNVRKTNARKKGLIDLFVDF